MFADMRAAAKNAADIPLEQLPEDINHASLTELIFSGAYDDEIFGDDDDDDDDEEPSPVRLVN